MRGKAVFLCSLLSAASALAETPLIQAIIAPVYRPQVIREVYPRSHWPRKLKSVKYINQKNITFENGMKKTTLAKTYKDPDGYRIEVFPTLFEVVKSRSDLESWLEGHEERHVEQWENKADSRIQKNLNRIKVHSPQHYLTAWECAREIDAYTKQMTFKLSREVSCFVDERIKPFMRMLDEIDDKNVERLRTYLKLKVLIYRL